MGNGNSSSNQIKMIDLYRNYVKVLKTKKISLIDGKNNNILYRKTWPIIGPQNNNRQSENKKKHKNRFKHLKKI